LELGSGVGDIVSVVAGLYYVGMIAQSDVLFMRGHYSNSEHYSSSFITYKPLWKTLGLESDVVLSPGYI
jgi:hypothetical protein